MDLEVGKIRQQAFEDEMILVVPTFYKLYQGEIHWRGKLDQYLDKNFSYYVQWRYMIQEKSITFYVAHIWSLEFKQFVIHFPVEE